MILFDLDFENIPCERNADYDYYSLVSQTSHINFNAIVCTLKEGHDSFVNYFDYLLHLSKIIQQG